jgi:hypothetical protein
MHMLGSGSFTKFTYSDLLKLLALLGIRYKLYCYTLVTLPKAQRSHVS